MIERQLMVKLLLKSDDKGEKRMINEMKNELRVCLSAFAI